MYSMHLCFMNVDGECFLQAEWSWDENESCNSYSAYHLPSEFTADMLSRYQRDNLIPQCVFVCIYIYVYIYIY